ncbi:unnamed protein product [Parnassius apollo]|uniref:Polyprenal reductase n=1 Tax=Parnassius apollo TaxID=110799 RepID=A0A8S3WXZ0_PARAO|nr:unnamed protein product [Parnassius apollo]
MTSRKVEQTIFLEQDESAVSASAAIIAMCLLTIQCIRRCYETYCLQVFAKSSKMNLSHYLVGMVHYFACVVAVVGQAPLFCGNQNRDKVVWTDKRTSILAIPCVLIFLYACYEQYQTNIIFANLRRDKKTGEVVTEEHRIPHGRLFELVSSPHRLCEILLYTVLIILIPTKTFFCIYLWVLSNQIQTAIQAHEWYKKSFKGYPANRFAILPALLYGSFGYKGRDGKILQAIELPKSYYRHFYVFAALFSNVTLVYMFMLYFMNLEINTYVHAILKAIFEQEEPAGSATAAFIAMSLITFHCVRRCYESHLLQVFASSGKMNIFHYGTAYVHYATVILATVGEAPLFCGDRVKENIRWVDTRTQILHIPCILIFLLASYEQYRSNVILANLRKDKKTGAVVTEEHRVPRGRLFEYVSSPHRLCEVILYIVIAVLIPTKTILIMCFWVLCNQIQCAVHAHVWYRKTFKDYPDNRMAIFPYIL